jgi:hypothetical protein
MARKVDLKAKAKRQKVMAAGGAVLLVGILAIQLPKTLNMLNAKPVPPPAPVAAPAPGTDPSVLPTPGTAGGAGTPVAATGGELTDSDPPPSAGQGQLVGFGRFASKDPFAPQVDPNKPLAGTPSASGGSGGSGGTGGTPGSPTPGSPAPGSPGVVAPTPSGPVSTAVIAMNGVEHTVAVKAEFPKDEPIFRLVSLTASAARIGIAGGALASGQPTVTLRRGKALTLVNTADGTRYELKLVSTS